MRLPFFKPKDAAPRALSTTAAAVTDDIQAARVRARRRLVGALVLLIAGVIAFPLVFETQPRPIGAQTAVEPGSRAVATAPEPAPAASRPAPVDRVSLAPPPDAGIEAAAPASATAAVSTSVLAPVVPTPPAPASSAAAPAPAASTPARAAPVAKPASAPGDGVAAKALLESTPSDTAALPGSGRFVVQVGAYAAAAPMKDVRAKVEKLGLKTYTQVIENAEGKRTRLRVGPFATRAEAEAAAAKLKAAGLPANLLSL